MARKPNVDKLPERDRREMLAKFLQALADHPDLSHFRTCVPAGRERELALFAAPERAAFRGNFATAPPAHDDFADQLLCDVLDCIDRDPNLSRHGSYSGADRHRVNLQALGAWTAAARDGIIHHHPIAPNCCSDNTYPSLDPNYSPAPQITGQFGDFIVSNSANSQANSDNPVGIIHHQDQTPGEKVALPARSLRRGRPPLIDELPSIARPITPMRPSAFNNPTAPPP